MKRLERRVDVNPEKIVLNKLARQSDSYKYKMFEVKWGKKFWRGLEKGWWRL